MQSILGVGVYVKHHILRLAPPTPEELRGRPTRRRDLLELYTALRRDNLVEDKQESAARGDPRLRARRRGELEGDVDHGVI